MHFNTDVILLRCDPLEQDRKSFEPKAIVYRSDELGSSSTGVRPLLTRRLHGQRYNKQSGIKHPTGQYTQAGRADISDRMPGPEWREKKGRDKFGPAGVAEDKRRKSPIVEISVLLVSRRRRGSLSSRGRRARSQGDHICPRLLSI